MTETPEHQEPVTEPVVPAEHVADVHRYGHRPNRVYQVAAWVAIVAGVVFIVGAVFFTGFALGRHSDGGPGWHQGGHRGGGEKAGPRFEPLMPTGPGGPIPPMGSGGPMESGGPMGSGGPMTPGPSSLPLTPPNAPPANTPPRS